MQQSCSIFSALSNGIIFVIDIFRYLIEKSILKEACFVYSNTFHHLFCCVVSRPFPLWWSHIWSRESYQDERNKRSLKTLNYSEKSNGTLCWNDNGEEAVCVEYTHNTMHAPLHAAIHMYLHVEWKHVDLCRNANETLPRLCIHANETHKELKNVIIHVCAL